jgi:hypothetical protein
MVPLFAPGEAGLYLTYTVVVVTESAVLGMTSVPGFPVQEELFNETSKGDGGTMVISSIKLIPLIV